MSTLADLKRKTESGGNEKSTKKSNTKKEIPENVIISACEHYRSYTESEDEADEDNEPDFDELYEVISLLEPFVAATIEDISINALRNYGTSLEFPSIDSLLPVLLSMVYLHLGDNAISQGFGEDNEGGDALEYLNKSLTYFPMNAATLSMLANYKKMNMLATLSDICSTYELAASNVHAVKNYATNILGGEDDENVEENLRKELVELLLLNEIAGVEFIEEDEEGVEEEAANESDADEQDEFTTSTVEATSSFMAALLHSTMNQHDEAIGHLAKFDFSHRIHPNVWLAATDNSLGKGDSAQLPTSSLEKLSFQPKAYAGNGPLPDDLYKRLCKIFSPSAAFWTESDYQNRGYFSFFEDITTDSKRNPRHLIDDVVVNYLLPRAQAAVPSGNIVGYEFWAHTRPLDANLGHQLHFDTDEALLAQENKVTHPIVSSVLYLTGNNKGTHENAAAGSTIVFNQTPSSGIATKAYISHTRDRKFMIFPGSCLHGVLPCTRGTASVATTKLDERLTLMFGFWTRRVPDKMKNRRLYGPCGPIPEACENTWVAEICQGYESTKHAARSNNKVFDEVEAQVLPSVSPAWEDISAHVKGSTEEKLNIPTALDHRYFVQNAASCFRESLFKKESI